MRYSINRISHKIIGAAIEVHKHLGPGLLESVYEYCLEKELRSRSLKVKRQCRIPIVYKEEELNKDFFIDLLIEGKVIVELKCVETILPVHEVQLVTYLKLSNLPLGLLINFNVPVLKSGIRRKINGSIEE